MKKYNHYRITLLISGVFGTLWALIFGKVQDPITIAVVIVLRVLIVVIGVGTASWRRLIPIRQPLLSASSF